MFDANNIQFRSKFTKNVTFSSAKEATAFKDFFVEILNHTEEFIVGLLWSLTYDPHGKASPKKFQDYLEKLSSFSGKQRNVLINELRYQFAQANPSFLDVPEKNLPEYQALASSSSEVTAYVVLQKCKDLGAYLQEFIGQELRHLSLSLDDEVDYDVEAGDKKLTNEEKVLKALTYLNFNREAARFLLPYAQKIASLLEAVTVDSSKTVVKPTTESPKHEEALPPTSSDENTLQEEHSTGSELVEQVSPSETPITSDLVIRYISELENFFQRLDRLKSRKVDTFYLVQSLPELKQFLQAVNDLEKLNLSVQEVFEKSSKIKDLLHALKQF